MTTTNPFMWIFAECGDEITTPTVGNVLWMDSFSAPLDDPTAERDGMLDVKVAHCECFETDPLWQKNSCSNTLIFDGSMGILRAAQFVADVKAGSGINAMWLLAGAFSRRFARNYVWKPSGIGPYLVNPETMVAK